MRLAECIDVNAPPALVWEYVTDPSRYLHFMSGVTRWSVEGEQERGLGARYRMLLRVGSAASASSVSCMRRMMWS